MRLTIRHAVVISVLVHTALVLLPGPGYEGPALLDAASGYLPLSFLDSGFERPGRASPEPSPPAVREEPLKAPVPEAAEQASPSTQATEPAETSAEQTEVSPDNAVEAAQPQGSPDVGAPESSRDTEESGGSNAGAGARAGGSAFQPPQLRVGVFPSRGEEDSGLEIPLKLHVTRAGRVDEVRALTEVDREVMQSVEQTVSAWLFAPARRGGKTVDAWVEMKFVYK